MPVCHRPEFLALTLEKLGEARGLPEVFIYPDLKANLPEVLYARNTYLPDAFVMHVNDHIAAPSGCWNVLNSIVKTWRMTGADRVFLVEEDIFVEPNFFEWHGEISGEFVASCGRRAPGFDREFPGIYTNPGSCLHADLIRNLAPHVNDDYFQRLREYMDEKLPPKWDEQSDLDDGLIRRVIRQMGGKCAFPEVPVALHKGFHHYDNVDIYLNRGTIEERIVGLRKMLARIVPGERYARDLEF
jgi:hypothetical protein